MPERKTYTLKQLCDSLKNYIDKQLKNQRYWVTCEISGLNEKSGHRYLGLVQTNDNKTVAKMEATLWAGNYGIIKNTLQDETDKILCKGNKVLLCIEVQYHVVYGLKLDIKDVDPSYTYGELELRKQETIKRLTELNLIGRNKEIKLPAIIKKVAVIASPRTSGYTDFIDHLEKNNYGYFFYYKLYEATVQGEKAEPEIIKQLIEADKYDYDAVILIRGGGSKLDLEVFNSFKICEKIATMRLPVITGIGHETDVSVADMVANTRQKTPTAVAHFIIETATSFHANMINKTKRITMLAVKKLSELKEKMGDNTSLFKAHTKSILVENGNKIELSEKEIKRLAEQIIGENAHKLIMAKTNIYNFSHNRIAKEEPLKIRTAKSRLVAIGKTIFILERSKIRSGEQRLDLLRPISTLKRGYSITRNNGTVIKNEADVKTGDRIITELFRLKIESQVQKIEKNGRKQ